MRKNIEWLLALTLGFNNWGCNNQLGIESAESETRLIAQQQVEEPVKDEDFEKKLEDNTLIKRLYDVVKKCTDLECVSKEGREFMQSEVEKVYEKMNSALARKDIPEFMRAYQEAVLFYNQLEKIGDCYKGEYGGNLDYDLNMAYFGNIHTLIMTNPHILEEWPAPAYCGSVNQTAESLATELHDFNWNRTISLGKDVGVLINGSGHTISHDVNTFLIAVSANLDGDATFFGEGRYFIDGTYTYMRFSERANLMVYNLITNLHSENPLESTAYRECSFIDLGMDGVDACDARLNGIQEEDIPAANERIIRCMTKTTEVLRRRYAGTGFIQE